VFDRFHRATDQQSGAGLGLAIADSIVRATRAHWRIGTSDAGGFSMTVLWSRALAPRRQAGRGGVSTSASVAPSPTVAPEREEPNARDG
jgi:hypothetical protein